MDLRFLRGHIAVRLSLPAWRLRDVNSLLLLGGALWTLKLSLHRYLAGLDSPLPLALSFLMMLGFTFRHEWKASRLSRRTFAMCVAHAWLFVLAALAAPLFRMALIRLLRQLNEAPDVIGFLSDYRAALGTAVVGYGGCFTIGLALGRWLVLPLLREAIFRLALLPDERSIACPHCGRLV